VALSTTMVMVSSFSWGAVLGWAFIGCAEIVTSAAQGRVALRPLTSAAVSTKFSMAHTPRSLVTRVRPGRTAHHRPHSRSTALIWKLSEFSRDSTQP